MDRDELEHMLERVSHETTLAQHQLVALQQRLEALMATRDGLRSLLQTMTDVEVQAPSAVATGTAPKPSVSVTVTPTEDLESGPGEKPTGSNAARQILQSDRTRFWTVRDVLAEEIRRGWAEPGKKRDATRVALVRLRERFPRSVERVDTPVMAYRWHEDLPSPNGSGTPHKEGAGW